MLLIAVLALLVFGYVIYMLLQPQKPQKPQLPLKEGFENIPSDLDEKDYSIYSNVIKSYAKALDRAPSSKELFYQFKRLKEGLTPDSLVKELFTNATKNGAVVEPMLGDDAVNPGPAPEHSTVTPPAPASIPKSDSKVVDPTLEISKAAMGGAVLTSVSDTAKASAADTPVAPSKESVVTTANAINKASSNAIANKNNQVATETFEDTRHGAHGAHHKKPHTHHRAPEPVSVPVVPTTSETTTTTIPTNSSGTTIVYERPTIYNYYVQSADGSDVKLASASATASALQSQTRANLDTNTGIPKSDPVDRKSYMIADPVDTPAKAKILNKDSAAAGLDLRDSDLQGAFNHSRNMNELRYGCQRSSKYTNAEDNMKLFPEYAWSIPQERAPVCISSGKNPVSPLTEQTSLTGTLLSDVKKNGTN